MAAVWMRLSAELRSRRRAMLGLALLLAIMGGGAIAAAAGARRTETAYPRFLERYGYWDLDISTGGNEGSEEVFSIAAELPQVVDSQRESLFYGSVRTASGKEARFPDVFFFGSFDEVPAGSRKILEGRETDPSAADESVLNYALADRLGVSAGDVVSITLQPQTEDTAEVTTRARVVGIFAEVGHFETVTGSGFPTVFGMSPAFVERWQRYRLPEEDTLLLRLRNGEADAERFTRDLHGALAARDLDDVLDGEPMPKSMDTVGVQGLNRVPATALWLLCAAIAVTTLAVFSQLLAREIRTSAGDYPTMSALGLGRGDLALVAIGRIVIVAVGGALGSVGVAFLLSPLSPVGLARIAEPDPGFEFAPAVLGIGALATMILAVVSALPAAWSIARTAGDPRAARAPGEHSRFSRWLAGTRLGPSARSGLQLVTQPGKGERALPTRTAVLGTAIAVAALAAALTFAVSLRHLINEPKLAGYTWDAGAIAAAFDPADQKAFVSKIETAERARFPDARVWKGTVFFAVTVEGVLLSGLASDGPPPSIIDGRAPQAWDEVAVDPKTLRETNKKIGDRVIVQGFDNSGEAPPSPKIPMRVVGTMAVPRIAFQGENPGQGVAFIPEGFRRLLPAALQEILDYGEAVYIDFPADADFKRELEAFRKTAADTGVLFAIVGRQQSATVGNVERIASLPNLLAAMMGTLGIATLAHALATTIRRRRRDLAILKTIGFVGRQVRATVAWQSTALVAAALFVGLPLGVAAGRWTWRLFAGSLQVVPVPVVSVAAIAAVAAGAFVLANVIAAFPARSAARTNPALVLRTE